MQFAFFIILRYDEAVAIHVETAELKLREV